MNADNERRWYMIMQYIKDGRFFQNEVAKRTGINRVTLSRIYKNLVSKNMIYCTNPKSNKFLQYRCTVTGFKFLAEFESHEKPKKKIGVENARFKCYIRNPKRLDAFLKYEKYNFKKSDKFKNNIIYDGKIEGVSVRVIHGANEIKNITLVMISPLFYADSAIEGHYMMWDNIVKFQDYLDETWQLDLSRVKLDSEHVEYTWNSPLAESMMKATGGSPVKSKKVSFNQSPPSLVAHMETKSWLDMDRHLDVPNKLDSLKDEIDSVKGEYAEVNYKISQVETNITILSSDLHEIVNLQKTNVEQNKKIADNIDGMRQSMTELAGIIKGNKSNVESLSEDNVKDLTDDSKRMFG